MNEAKLRVWGWLLLAATVAAGCGHVHVRRDAAERMAATAIAGFASGCSQDQGHAGAQR
jgi:hypothetical protein